MHQLTRDEARGVRFRAWLWNGTEYQIHFDFFRVENRSTNYTLRLGGYNSSASIGVPASCEGNFLTNNNRQFTTKDRDNDGHASNNCAKIIAGAGWWYKKCTNVSPNAKYCPSESCGKNHGNMKVACLMGAAYSMKKFQIDVLVDDE